MSETVAHRYISSAPTHITRALVQKENLKRQGESLTLAVVNTEPKNDIHDSTWLPIILDIRNNIT